MAKKKLILEFTFEEVQEDVAHLKPKHVKLHQSTTLTDMELDALGEEIGQTDRWQVDNWNAIQSVMGGSTEKARLQ